MRKFLIGFVLLLVTVAVLLWFLPARWVVPWIEPQLHGIQLQQISGSLWSGRAGAIVTADAQTLGEMRWQLSRRLLVGERNIRVQIVGPQLMASVDARQLPDSDVEVRDTGIRVTLALVDQGLVAWFGQPRGELRMQVPHALLRAGWPMQMDGQATWHDAVIRTSQGDVVLGELHATVQARAGVIAMHLSDSGSGPLQLAGDLQLSPLGWRLDATLRARQTDPALRRWLATLGTAAADGSVHLQNRGGITASTPAPLTH